MSAKTHDRQQLRPVDEKFTDTGMPSINSGQEMQHLLFNPAAMNQLHQLAEVMAKSVVTVPKHLQGKPGDCLAICMQAAQWRMNPFAVAQKTHLSQSGQLGYEAQLVNAVINSIAPTETRLEYEFLGDWSKILGRVKEMKSEKGGKYYVANWNPADEQGLGVKAYATIKGESERREITVMMSQCYPRFSTQWATDPQQQITYVATKKWARRYCPDVILGVYTPEELENFTPPERDITGKGGAETHEAVISEDQAGEIRELLKKANLPEKGLLEKAGLDRLEDLPEWRYAGVKDYLEAKVAAKKEAQGAKKQEQPEASAAGAFTQQQPDDEWLRQYAGEE